MRAQATGHGYETQRLDLALQERGLRVATAPEGREIRYVRVIREQVFAPDEFFGDLPGSARTWRTHTRRHPVTVVNGLHALTREVVVRRELPFAVGRRYRQVDADEGMRNLRKLGIFALVRVVAVELPGDQEGVGVVVYTRDFWTLRFETNFEGTAGNYRLLGQLAERNLLGRGKTGLLRYELRTATFSVGEVYYDYRLAGGQHELSESFDLIVNRASGKPEGAVVGLSFARPFYRLAQRWSYELSLRDVHQVSRTLDSTGQVIGADLSGSPTVDVVPCAVSVPECAPQVYASASARVSAAVHRRIGYTVRHTLSAGAVVNDRRARAIAETGLAPGQLAAFEARVLPAARRLVYPYLRHRVDTPRFTAFTNLGTYGVSENVQLGPWTDASFGLPLSVLGSTADGLLAGARAGYVAQLGQGLLDLSAGAGARLQGRRTVDQELTGQLRAATPPWLAGRLVLLGRLEARRRDTARTVVSLDSAGGLRGYPVGAFVLRGGSRMFGSLEYRTLPLALDAVHVGAVAFYDGGSLFRELRDLRYHHCAGIGLRLLLPQFNRFVLRIDAGAALDAPGFSVVASYGSGQAVPLTPTEDRAREADIRAQ